MFVFDSLDLIQSLDLRKLQHSLIVDIVDV